MSKNSKWSEFYGRLEFLPREEYFRGHRWVYVASEELDEDGVLYDIVRTQDGGEWRYTLI